MTAPVSSARRFAAFPTIDDEPWETRAEASALLGCVRELESLGIGHVQFTETLDCEDEASDVLSNVVLLSEARRRFLTVFRGGGVPELAPVALQSVEP